MSRAIRDAALVLADGSTFEGEWIGADPDRRRHASGRGRVQHRAHRLPGDHHRPVLRRPDHHLHLPAHRQLRRDAGRRREPPRRSVAASSSATWPRRRSNWRSEEDLDAYLARLGVPAIGGIDTRRLTRIIRDSGAIPGAFGPLDLVDEATLKQAAADEPGHRRRRPRRAR